MSTDDYVRNLESALPSGEHVLMVSYRGQTASIIIPDDSPLELKAKCFDKCKFALLRKEYSRRRYQELKDHGVPESTLEKLSDYREVMTVEEGQEG